MYQQEFFQKVNLKFERFTHAMAYVQIQPRKK